jgi:hypothetical protein
VTRDMRASFPRYAEPPGVVTEIRQSECFERQEQ